MHLDIYQQQARTTAVYPNRDKNMIYPTLGLLGECGEICEKIKKLERDDNNIIIDQRRTAIAKKLGDIMWYTADLCSEIGTELDMIYKMRGFKVINHTRNFDLPRIVFHLCFCAAELAKAIEQWYYNHHSAIYQYPCHANVTTQMSCIVHCVAEIAHQVCEMSLEEICAINLKKLLSRKDRGTLFGSGDDH